MVDPHGSQTEVDVSPKVLFTHIRQYELFIQVRQSPVILRHDTQDSFEDYQPYP